MKSRTSSLKALIEKRSYLLKSKKGKERKRMTAR